MKSVQNGSVVLFDYVGKLNNGKVYDTTLKNEAQKTNLFMRNKHYEPQRVIIGQHQIFIGLEEALIGMKEGESKDVTIPPEKAYGQLSENLIKEVPRHVFQRRGIQPQEGKRVTLRTLGGDKFQQ